MSSDVCKHCTRSGLPRRVPDRLALPHRVRHRGGAGRHLQRLRLLRAGLPVRRDRSREEDGRVFKCTLCYDRLRSDMQPACAQACPTDSIQFGELDDLRDDGVGGAGAFFLLLDEPEVYGLPPDPVVTTVRLPAMWGAAAAAATTAAALVAAALLGGRR
jgi:formate dehydrogenase iron-sulfur subunit